MPFVLGAFGNVCKSKEMHHSLAVEFNKNAQQENKYEIANEEMLILAGYKREESSNFKS